MIDGGEAGCRQANMAYGGEGIGPPLTATGRARPIHLLLRVACVVQGEAMCVPMGWPLRVAISGEVQDTCVSV